MNVEAERERVESVKELFESFDPDYREELEEGIEKLEGKEDSFWEGLERVIERNLQTVDPLTMTDLQEVLFGFVGPQGGNVVASVMVNSNSGFLEELYKEYFDMTDETFERLNRISAKYQPEIKDAKALDIDSNILGQIKTAPTFPVPNGDEPALDVDIIKSNSEQFKFTVLASNSAQVIGTLLEGLKEIDAKTDEDVSEYLPQNELEDLKDILEDLTSNEAE